MGRGRPRGWASEITGRPPMRSPGRPGVHRRDEQQAFWRRIAAGPSTEDAAVTSGVPQPLGTRWFRVAGGMAPIALGSASGRYLSFAEREELALLRPRGAGFERRLTAWAERRRRFRVSCAVTPRPVAAS